MKKTKIMGAALSAVVVGLLAVGCDSAVLNDIADKLPEVKPGVSEGDVATDMFDPGKEISFWYGDVLNQSDPNYKTSAIMKIEPLPVGTSTAIDGYVEFAVIEETGNIANNTGWLGTYKLTGETTNTKKMKLTWGGTKEDIGMDMFSLVLKPGEREAWVRGSSKATEDFEFTMYPAAVGSKNLSVEELTKGFPRATGADKTNFILSLQDDGSFEWGGKINGFKMPDGGRYEIAENGEITLWATATDGSEKVLNRVAGTNVSDEGHASVVAEKCLWIAFDSTDLQQFGYTGRFFSNLPILFSLNSNTVTK